MDPQAYYNFYEGQVVKAEEAFAQTTDATVTTLATITPDDPTMGFLEVTLFAYKIDGSKSITGKKFVHWSVSAGTASVINIADEVADSLDNLTTATWTVDATGATLRIRVTGEGSTDLDWLCYYKLQSLPLTPP